MKRRSKRFIFAARRAMAVILSIGLAAPVWADEHPSASAKEAAAKTALPSPAVTEQSVDLGGRQLEFKSTVAAMAIKNAASGEVLAEVVTTAYVAEGGPKTNACRPIVFAFNGGPGASSAWLDLGAIGPWRVKLAGAVPSSPPLLADNKESWLDFADLVFIDPPGTGFSRVVGAEASRKRFWSVEGDVDVLALVVRRWLQQARKLDCPVFLAGESYGGFRAPKVARTLQEKENVGVAGLVLLSPALDFGWMEGRNNPLIDAVLLPSLAASHMSAKSRSDVAAAEAYASGDYLADILRGTGDAQAQERIAARISALTGLSTERVRRYQGRIGATDWALDSDPSGRKITSLYDGATLGANPAPGRRPREWSDPVLDAMRAPLGAAMTALTVDKLKWPVETARYEILNNHIAESWDWGSGRHSLETLSDLRQARALDPHLKVLVAQGLYDLVTPYYGNKLLLDLTQPGGANPVGFIALPGGHMFYTINSPRAALRDAARKMIVGD